MFRTIILAVAFCATCLVTAQNLTSSVPSTPFAARQKLDFTRMITYRIQPQELMTHVQPFWDRYGRYFKKPGNLHIQKWEDGHGKLVAYEYFLSLNRQDMRWVQVVGDPLNIAPKRRFKGKPGAPTVKAGVITFLDFTGKGVPFCEPMDMEPNHGQEVITLQAHNKLLTLVVSHLSREIKE